MSLTTNCDYLGLITSQNQTLHQILFKLLGLACFFFSVLQAMWSCNIVKSRKALIHEYWNSNECIKQYFSATLIINQVAQVCSDLKLYERKPIVWPFKCKLSSSTFMALNLCFIFAQCFQIQLTLNIVTLENELAVSESGWVEGSKNFNDSCWMKYCKHRNQKYKG